MSRPVTHEFVDHREILEFKVSRTWGYDRWYDLETCTGHVKFEGVLGSLTYAAVEMSKERPTRHSSEAALVKKSIPSLSIYFHILAGSSLVVRRRGIFKCGP